MADASILGGGLIHYATMLVPSFILMKKNPVADDRSIEYYLTFEEEKHVMALFIKTFYLIVHCRQTPSH